MGKKTTALIILDGFGDNPGGKSNAILAAGTPYIDALKAEYPHSTLGASGMDVGLPDGQMGNSEVGHLNIGAGRVVYQELTRVTKSILDGDFFANPAFLGAINNVKKTGGALHLLGLCSDGGVHSHLTHLFAFLRLAKDQGLNNAYVHCFMDGRDVPPSSGLNYIKQTEAEMARINFGTIATVSGRYWAMDRDKRWERVNVAYDAMVLGQGATANSAVQAMEQSYAKGETDEFVKPTVVMKDGVPVRKIAAGDSVIFFNFRPDRAREITRAFIEPDFLDFPRLSGYQPVYYVSLTQYDATFVNLHVAYTPQSLSNTMGEYLAERGLSQLHIAETEKYAHVTFFFNGGVEAPNALEERVLIPSPKVATYDLQPEMSAYEVAKEAAACVRSGKYDVMILNFANCDMVGHTGIFGAAEAAVRAVDGCVKTVVEAIFESGGRAIITADHGNADQMVDPETGEPFTAHTTNPVPVIVCDPARKDIKLRSGGRLCDLAPTMLDLMGIPRPKEMTGESLLVHRRGYA